MPPKIEPIVRFRKKWKLSTEHFYDREACWEWTAYRNKDGYGQFSVDGESLAHRFAYEHFREPIPEGLWVLHHCDNPGCCNPAHLFLGTHADNARDRDEKGRCHNSKKTHCPKDHRYDYVYPDGRRACKTCRSEVNRRSYHHCKKRAA